MSGTPAVSHVRLVDVDGDGRLDMLGTDMRQGLVFTGTPAAPASALTDVASIPHPAHVTLADVDKDGVQDLLVAEMGEFFPADHAKGAVIWMRGLAKGKFGAFWLDGWPRVASVDAADFNGDGKIDLAVAAFGWRKTGQVAILENRTDDRVAAVLHHPHHRSARRQHPARSRRSEPRRPDGLRHAARAGARNRPRLHQQGRRRLHVRAAR